MQRINTDIQNNTYARVYLLYGEESYLRHQYRDKLRDAVATKDDSMNYHYYEGKSINFGAIIDLAETMPFLAEYKVIVIENSGACTQSADQIAEYIQSIPESTILIFVEEAVDRRNKLYKAIAKYGHCANFERQTEAILTKWIGGLLQQEGKTIPRETIGFFLEKTGFEMEQIRMELEKLTCYTYGREEITSKDVEAIVSTRIQNHIFDMLSAITMRNQREALRLYYDLLGLKEPPMKILVLLAKQFNQLYHVKLLQGKGYQEKVIAKELGIQPFLVAKYARQARGSSIEHLRQAVEDCVQLDERIKTGRENDRTGVELFIITYSASESRKKGVTTT
ncbi:MAG: DNA polymerase III subunit delta [Eubacteriales bacterium]